MNAKRFLTRRRALIALGLGFAAVFTLLLWTGRNNTPPDPHAAHRPAPVHDAAPAPAAIPPSSRITGYRSTMMPGEISDTPRKDSMGMDMVPIYESEGSMLELSDHACAMASVETRKVERVHLTHEIRAVGKVQYNETGLADVVSRVDGYVERLYVDFTGMEVKVGDHLVELYSPDLVVAQQEMLVALESSRSPDLVESTTRKLLRWGLTRAQIDALVQNRTVQERLTLFSPIAGTVTEKLVVQKSAVRSGDVLYRLANLDSVWVYLDIYEFELAWVQYGQTVELTSEAFPGEVFMGRVWFISPVLDEATRTVKTLINVDNSGRRLKPGMFVSALIGAELRADGSPARPRFAGQWSCPMHPLVLQPKGGPCPVCGMALVRIPGEVGDGEPAGEEAGLLAVPVTAVLDSGLRKLVYVEKQRGEFVPVEIVTGPRSGNFYPVLQGLQEGQSVVVRGGFLLDSQSQIRGLPSLFYPEGLQAGSGHDHTAGTPAPPAQSAGHAHHPAGPSQQPPKD